VTRRNGLLSTALLTLTGAVVGLLVVGCGIRPTAVIHGQEAPKGAVTSMVLYLLDHGTLRAVARPLPPTATVPANGMDGKTYIADDTRALNALLQGPTATEASGGLTSDVPPDLVGFIPHNGDDPGNIIVYIKAGNDVSLTQHAVDQIVCTVITAQVSEGVTTDTHNLKVTVDTVSDRRNQPRPPQKCPLDTP
jgi:hypothetical protein